MSPTKLTILQLRLFFDSPCRHTSALLRRPLHQAPRLQETLCSSCFFPSSQDSFTLTVELEMCLGSLKHFAGDSPLCIFIHLFTEVGFFFF